jgi:hypothetical protein
MDPGSLKDIEKKAYQVTFADGLWDIFFGLLLLANAASPLLEFMQLPRQIAYAIFLLSPLVLILGRRYITTPRMGLVRYGAGRRARRTILLLLIIAFIFFTFLLYILMVLGKNYVPAVLRTSPHPWLAWAVEAFFLTGALWLIAYFLQFTRLYFYAVLVGFGFPLMEYLYPITGTPLNAILAYGVPGFLVVTFGLLMLIRFIIKYPPYDPSDLYQRQDGNG